MASTAYFQWVTVGKPYTLIRPARDLQRNVRRHGLVVYDYPNEAHLTAEPPEDHTPFSYTGYPGANRRWNARGLDVMPRSSTNAGRAENAAIAEQIIADRDAKVPGTEWIKYLNYTDLDGNCWHVSWQPEKRVTRSTDCGHIHISGRSDFDDWAGAAGYDPVARLTGGDAEVVTDDDVRRIAQGVWELFRAPVGPDGTAYNMQDHVLKTEFGVSTLKTAVTALAAEVARLAELILAGDGSADVAVILAGIQTKLDTLRAQVEDDTRGAVADLGEGGAERVRAGIT